MEGNLIYLFKPSSNPFAQTETTILFWLFNCSQTPIEEEGWSYKIGYILDKHIIIWVQSQPGLY